MILQLSKKSERKINQIKYYCNRLITSAYWNIPLKHESIFSLDSSYDEMKYVDAIVEANARFERESSNSTLRSSLGTILALLYSIEKGNLTFDSPPKLIVLNNYYQYPEVVLLLVKLDNIRIVIDPSKILSEDLFHSLEDVKDYPYEDIYTVEIIGEKTISQLMKRKTVLV
ncbi:MAG: hypothetical protein ACOX6Q_02580 [Candidatus Dojkabacteria bacterium]|jgi:hypothetical protein